MKSLVLIVTFIFCLTVAGCKNQPAQNESQQEPLTKADLMNKNQSASNNPVAQVEQGAQAAAAQQNAAGNPSPTVKPPAFLDMAKGGVTDLPAYKDARIVSVQHGPVNGAASALLLYETGDPLSKVTVYYDGVVKGQGWKVGSNIRGPESVEMSLFKGDRDEALLKIGVVPQTQRTQILISRTQRPLATQPK